MTDQSPLSLTLNIMRLFLATMKSTYLSIYLSQMHLSCRILVLQSLLVLRCALWQSPMVCYQVGLTQLAYSMLHTQPNMGPVQTIRANSWY